METFTDVLGKKYHISPTEPSFRLHHTIQLNQEKTKVT